MKVDKLNQLFALVANIGVFIGLIFLIIELNQANRIARADAESALRDKSIELHSWTTNNPEFAVLQSKLSQPDAELTPEEEQQAKSYAIARVNLWSTAQQIYDNEMLSETTYERFAIDPDWQLDNYPSMGPFYANWVESRHGLIEVSSILGRLSRALSERGY